MPGPLSGINVLDMSQIIAGPSAAMYMADLGAAVIKIEPPGGDVGRDTHTTERLGKMSKPFLALNRNKRSIVVDLRKPEGLDIARCLVRWADVLVINMRPDAAKRLGLDYETLERLHPRLVYVTVSAYGTRGAERHKKGYDLVIQGRAGILAARRHPDGTPVLSPLMVTDLGTGLMLAYGIAAALVERARSGKGQKVETSLLQAAIAMQSYQMVRVEGDTSPIPGSLMNAMYTPYRCADGEWLIMVIVTDEEWRRLCNVLGRPDLAQDLAYSNYTRRLANAGVLQPLIQRVVETRPRVEWLKLMDAEDLVAGPIVSREEVFDDPQVRVNDMIITQRHPVVGNVDIMGVPLAYSRTPGAISSPAPTVGEHTDDILREIGYTAEDVARLRQADAVG